MNIYIKKELYSENSPETDVDRGGFQLPCTSIEKETLFLHTTRNSDTKNCHVSNSQEINSVMQHRYKELILFW